MKGDDRLVTTIQWFPLDIIICMLLIVIYNEEKLETFILMAVDTTILNNIDVPDFIDIVKNKNDFLDNNYNKLCTFF